MNKIVSMACGTSIGVFLLGVWNIYYENKDLSFESIKKNLITAGVVGTIFMAVSYMGYSPGHKPSLSP